MSKRTGFIGGFGLACILLLAGVTFLPAGAAGFHDLPFRPSEKLTFQVKWVFIPAGEAVLEVLPVTTLKGVKAHHFVMTARTFDYIDPFYKVRDRIESFVDMGMQHSILYKKDQAGKRKRRVVVHFDWHKKTARYSNFDEKGDPVSIQPGSFDPLAVFYAFRLFDLEEGLDMQIPVTDGKKSVIGKGKVIKRERITVAGKPYDTVLVEPELKHIGGVFEKSKKARLQIWVTDDKSHIPVRIKSKVVVGSFIAELVSAENVN